MPTSFIRERDHDMCLHHFVANRWGKKGNSDRLFFWAPKSLQMVTAAMKLKDTCSLEKKRYDQPRQHIKSRDITLSKKVHLVKAMVFPIVTYGCESWISRKLNAEELHFQSVLLEKTLESPLDSKEIHPVHPKGNQS